MSRCRFPSPLANARQLGRQPSGNCGGPVSLPLVLLVAAMACTLSAIRAGAEERPRTPASAKPRPNVLLICVDDLRGQLGHLGDGVAQTPAIDRFAASAVSFARHYVQVPTCGASRAALMRGRYPEVAAHLSNDAILKTQANWADESLPAWFRGHGYQTHSLGKVTHYPGNLTGENWAASPEELPGAWDSAGIPRGPWRDAKAMMHGFSAGRARRPGQSPALESTAGPDSLYPDAWVADAAIEKLATLQASATPWFFAVGFFKPHLPFAAPQAWFDRHDSANFAPPANAARPTWPSGWHASGEFRGNYGHQGRDPDTDPAYAQELRRAYAAAVSYMDHQLGRLLESLDRLDPNHETLVVIWGDHGFLLGEHAIWGKHCLYEEALRSPLLIRIPQPTGSGETPPTGVRCEAIVETVDLFPTLTDYCGLTSPPALTGHSLRRYLEEPAAPTAKPACGFWGNGSRSLRTDRWRLIRTGGRGGAPPAIELFDYELDPAETKNVAAAHPEVLRELEALLSAYHW